MGHEPDGGEAANGRGWWWYGKKWGGWGGGGAISFEVKNSNMPRLRVSFWE